MTGGAAPAANPALGRMLIAVLTAVIMVAPILGQGSKGAFTGLIGAAAFWFGFPRLIAWVSKRDAGSTDAQFAISDTLQPVLDRLEATRVEWAATIEARMRLRVPLGVGGGVLLWAWGQFGRDPPDLVLLFTYIVSGATIGWVWASAKLGARYRALYQAEVLPRLAAGFGDLVYRRAAPLDLDQIRSQRLFDSFDAAAAEDEIAGQWHGVPVSIVEARLTRGSGKNRRITFDGLLTRVTLPRMLEGTTAVIPDGGLSGALRDQFGDRATSRVRVESSAFEAIYQVYATDQVAARALLTPAFMERFLELGARTGFARPVALAEGNQLTIALGKSGFVNLFEPPSYSEPAASRNALARLHGDIAAVLSVASAVVDLDQSVRARP